MSDTVVSLDIGSSKVCTLIAEMNKKQFRVVGVGTSECKGVKKGIIVDIDSTVEAIKIAINKAEQMSNRKIKSVFVNIPGGYTSLYKNKGVIAVSRDDKEITNEDLRRVTKAAQVVAIPSDKEIIDTIPIQYIVDGYNQISDPVGMVGVRLEVDADLVVASCITVQNIKRCIQKAGLILDGIIVEPLGTASVILNKDEMELGVVLIDIGAGTTDISVFKKGELIHTKVIPVGGNNITNDISQIFTIPSADSEKIKKQFGVASAKMIKQDEIIKVKDLAGKGEKEIRLLEVAQIIDDRVYEMMELIKDYLTEQDLNNNLGAGIVITGGGFFNIRGIIDIAQEYFNLPVRYGYPNYTGVANPIYASAVGLSMYALNNKKTSTVNSNEGQTHFQPADSDIDEEEDDDNKVSIFDRIKDYLKDFF